MRTQKGMTLMELVVSSVLVGFSLAAVAELVAVNTFASTKLTNKIDGQVGAGRAIRRITEDVRQARKIGNVNSFAYRNYFPDNKDSASFDPFVTAPIGGWPAAPWSSIPYQLGPQTLIIQQPVCFDKGPNLTSAINGFPLRMDKDSLSAGLPSFPLEYVDTTVYQLVADEKTTGMYELQVVRFSGIPVIAETILKPSIAKPQTVLKGIVGPIDPANPSLGPTIFHYLTSPNGTVTLPFPDSSNIDAVRGVSINLEVRMPSTNQGANQEICAVHAETFVRAGQFLRFTND